MTGRDPGELGIYGFRNRRDHGYNGLELVSSYAVGEPAIWDYLGISGRYSIIMGMPLTFPPRPLRGEMVADFMAPEGARNITYPLVLLEELEASFGKLLLEEPDFRGREVEHTIGRIRSIALQRFKMARHLLTTRKWDFAAVIETGCDRLQHMCWQYMDPEHVGFVPNHPLADVVAEYYGFLDEQIAMLLEGLYDNTLVIVLSDHGAKRMDGGFCINNWLIESGFLTLKHPPDQVKPLRSDQVDWSKTVAWAEGGYYGRIFLNLEGREPEGIVSPARYQTVCQEITKALEAVRGPDGNRLGNRIFQPGQIYKKCHGVPPDLILYPGNLYWRAIGSIGHPGLFIRENDTGLDGANHSQEAMIIAHDPAGEWFQELPSVVSIYDIAPTILGYFGMPIPEGLRGKPLKTRVKL